jgi:hypothetical protein
VSRTVAATGASYPEAAPLRKTFLQSFSPSLPNPRRNTLEIKEIPREVFSKKKDEMNSMDRYGPHGGAGNS